MLYTFAVKFPQKFFNLAAPAFTFFIERDTDFTIWRGERFRGQTRIFALDIEIADFLEIKELLIKFRPIGHAPAVNIMGQVIDDLKTASDWVPVHTL